MTLDDRHKDEKLALLSSLKNLDSEVKSAILNVAERTSPHHTVQSKRYSLLNLVKEIIDPAVADWLRRNNVTVEWKYSDLILGDHGFSLALLQKLAMRDSPDDWAGPDKFTRTCDALISFLIFSANHHSKHVKVVKLEPSKSMDPDEAADRHGWGAKRGSRKKIETFPAPDYLISTFKSLRDRGLCIACGEPTFESAERQRLIQTQRDKLIKKSLGAGMQFFSHERGSSLYCVDHAKSTGGAAGEKKGQRQRIRFMSLLLALTRSGVVSHVNKRFPPSFDVKFAQQAIKDPGGLRDLKVIEDNLPVHIFADDEEIRSAATEKIVATIEKIFFHRLKLTTQPYDSEVAMDEHLSRVENGIYIRRQFREI